MAKIKESVLPRASLELLKVIMSDRVFKDFYLVGGTNLALKLGHRESHDLDFFSQKEFSSNIVDDKFNKVRVISKQDNSIELLVNKTKVFFFRFAYPLYKNLQIIDGIRFADSIDVGLMKLLALQGRTTRKDIIDLYFIDRNVISLKELLLIFEKFYPKESFNSYDSVKKLIGHEFLTREPAPKLLIGVNWNECLQTVEKAIIDHIDKLRE